MKLNSKVIEKIYRNNEWQIPPFNWLRDKADLVVPFTVKAGFINATEKGNTFSQEITDYSRFERIFTGFESVILEWENSTTTEVVNSKLVKKLTTGRTLDMWIDNSLSVDEVSELDENSDFLTERVVSTITAYSTKEISEFDLLKMYTFPEKHGKVLFHIDNVVSYNNPANNVDKYYRVTFKSVNDRLSHTGISINQYIQNSAPGEGYAYPKVVNILETREITKNKVVYLKDISSIREDGEIFYIQDFENNIGVNKVRWNDNSKEWELISNEFGIALDKTLLNSNPVASFQLEIFGKGLLSDVYFYGRPLNAVNDENGNEVKQSRQLLLNQPQQFDNTQRDITQPYARNTAYNWIKKSQLVVESWYDSWAEQRKSSVNPGSTKKWMGALEMFYGSANEVVTVNPFARAIGDIFTFGIAEAFWPTTTEFKKSANQNGTVYEIQPDANGVFDFSAMFNNNFYKNKSVPRLPVDYQESVIWSLKEIPLIGGFLNKLTLGLNRGWRQSTDLGGKHYNVSGIMPSGLLNFYQNAYMPPKKKASTALGGDNSAYTAIPLDDLQADASPSSLSKVDFATMLNYSLTDQFTDVDALGTKGATFETADFNYQDAAGIPLVTWDQSRSHAITNNTVSGYAIDLFGIHFVGDADIKLTFFDANKNPVWTTKLKTLSNLTKSTRDWNTTYKLSSWSAPNDTNGHGVVVDTKTPYRMKTSDYTIDISSSMQDRLRNGFPKSDTSHGSFETDANNKVIRDANGNPISKITSTGVQETTAVANLVDGAVDNVKTSPQSNQKITTIQELTLPISPTRILETANLVINGTQGRKVYSNSLVDILNKQKFGKDAILQFNKAIIKPSFKTEDSRGNVYEGTDEQTYNYDLTFNIVQENTPTGFRFELLDNFKPVSGSRVQYELFGTGSTNIEWSINKNAEFEIDAIVNSHGFGPGVTHFDLTEIILIK